MYNKHFIIIIAILGVVFTSCSLYDEPDMCDIEILLSQPDFTVRSLTPATRATAGAATLDDEKEIQNLYVFLFPRETGHTLLKYYITTSTFTEGTWTVAENKISINRTQAEVGSRDVYIVANCADLETQLDAVTTVDELKDVLRTVSPWTIETPLLMEGHVDNHNFRTNYQLISVPLIRAVAKLKVNVTLSSAEHQNTDKAQYKYRYLDFGNRTYVMPRTDDPQVLANTVDNVTNPATDWNAIPADSLLTNASNKVDRFTLPAIYFNEYNNTAATDPTPPVIELALPYEGGILPPPEFGPGDIYRIQLPLEIERNTIYTYDLTIAK